MFQFDNPWWPATIKHSHTGESKRPNDEWTPNSWVRNAQIMIKTGKKSTNVCQATQAKKLYEFLYMWLDSTRMLVMFVRFISRHWI